MKRRRKAEPTARLTEDPAEYRAVPLRIIDLFCGIGGFRIAFARAGGRCVFSSDYDKFSQQTYEANFGERPHGNIHTVAVADIPAHDILCGGFPCQPFSIAGVSKKLSLGRKHGFAGIKQGNLVFSIADILDFWHREGGADATRLHPEILKAWVEVFTVRAAGMNVWIRRRVYFAG